MTASPTVVQTIGRLGGWPAGSYSDLPLTRMMRRPVIVDPTLPPRSHVSLGSFDVLAPGVAAQAHRTLDGYTVCGCTDIQACPGGRWRTADRLCSRCA